MDNLERKSNELLQINCDETVDNKSILVWFYWPVLWNELEKWEDEIVVVRVRRSFVRWRVLVVCLLLIAMLWLNIGQPSDLPLTSNNSNKSNHCSSTRRRVGELVVLTRNRCLHWHNFHEIDNRAQENCRLSFISNKSKDKNPLSLSLLLDRTE